MFSEKTLALKRKVDITVPKLKKDVVNLWMNNVPHWSTLDPYSDLEEITSDSSLINEPSETSDTEKTSECVYFSKIGGHILRKRHRSYSNECA